MDFESQDTSNKIQIDVNGDSHKRKKVGRPRKIKRTIDDQGNQLTSQINIDSNNTQNEIRDLSNNSRGGSFNNTEALFNGPANAAAGSKLTIGQRKTRR